MAYYIVSAKKTFTFYYDPFVFDNATACSQKCTCSNSSVPEYALSINHLSGVEQFARGHKHIQGCEKFINVENLIHSAHKQGYRHVMLNDQRNVLKLIISSLETNVGDKGVTAVYQELVKKQNDIIKLIEMHSLAMIVARLKALSLGMKVVNTNYQYDLGGDVCGVVKTAASKLRKRMTSYTFGNLGCVDNLCFTENTENDELLLEDRVGANGKTLLEQLLSDTNYAWMLTFQTNDWPLPETNPYYHIDPLNFLDSPGDGVLKDFDLKKALDSSRCV
jgi:hypothetical protein